MSNPSEPFTRASIYLGPLFEAHGFRPVAREYDDTPEGSAMAEYLRGSLALRLVWEGTERVLWIEAARSTGGSVISRWTDIEWVVAGERRLPDPALDDARLERLAAALTAYLAMARSGGRLPDGVFFSGPAGATADGAPLRHRIDDMENDA